MKQKMLLSLLIPLSLLNGNISVSCNYNDFNLKGANHIITRGQESSLKTISLRERKKSSKKDIKKEIKRRKKYHKSLLELYNKSFENKYLKLIRDNSIKINNLRKVI